MNKELDFYVKWAATLVIVGATMANSFDIAPLNKVLFLLGCMLWTWVGFLWKLPSLWSLNMFCGTLYVIGFMR